MLRDYELGDASVMFVDVHEAMSQAREVGLAQEAIRTELVPVINGFRANTEDIRRWWSTQDPLLETNHLVVEASIQLMDHDCGYLHSVETDHAEDIITMAKAGVSVLSELVAGTNPLDLSYAQKLRDPDDSKLDYNLLLEFIYTELQSKSHYSVEDFENLALAQELLEGATQHMALGLRNNRISIGNKTPEQTEEILYFQAKIAELSNNILYSLIYAQEPGQYATPGEIEEADRIRLIGLHSSIHLTAFYESTSDIERFREHDIAISDEDRKEQLKRFITDLQRLFDNPASTMNQRLKKPHIKGPLHEAMWFLDTAMLKHAYHERYAHLAVWQATQSANRPTIGRPEWNRAYDYIIRKGDDMHCFQLKASRQENKPHYKTYHPGIVPLEEENFKELQPKRLAGKLRQYSQLLDEDFPPEITSDVLDKYVMRTAQFAMDSCRSDLPSRQAYLKEILSKHYLPGFKQHVMVRPLNRAERRAEAKAARKKSKQVR